MSPCGRPAGGRPVSRTRPTAGVATGQRTTRSRSRAAPSGSARPTSSPSSRRPARIACEGDSAPRFALTPSRISRLSATRTGSGAIGDIHHDPRRVRHATLRAEVPRPDDGRAPPLPRAHVEPPEALLDGDLGDQLGPGRQVPELLAEQARSVLLEQRRRPALEDAPPRRLARRRAPIDLAGDPATTEPERVARHRAVGGERQQVGDREWLGVGIPEALRQHPRARRPEASARRAPAGEADGRRSRRAGPRMARRTDVEWAGPGIADSGWASFRLTRPTHRPANW